MEENKVKTPKDGGFGARLAYAILYTLGAVICLILSFVFTPPDGEMYEDLTFLLTLLYVLAVVFGFYSAVCYVCAFAGVKHKWADVLIIILGAPMCFGFIGLLAVIGGAIGIKDINDPEGAAERRKKRNGFGWRLTFAIIRAVAAICFIICTIAFVPELQREAAYIDEYTEGTSFGFFMVSMFGMLSGICVVMTVLGFIGAFAGKKHKWANTLSIVIGAITAGSLLGIPAIVGGVQGNKYLDRAHRAAEESEAEDGFESEEIAAEAARPAEVAEPAHTEFVKGDTVEEARRKVLADFPVDYDNKPAVSRLLDADNTDNLFLENEDGNTYEFHQLYVTLCGGKIYALTETVGLSEDEGGGLIVFRVDYESDTFHVEEDDALCESVLEEYKQAVNAANQYEKQEIKRSDFKLDLYDSNIDEKTWKDFKKTASQEELAVIAIGAKYRVAHSRIKNIIYAIGIILSIALFWPTGGWSLIGYPVFSFLATKSIRYEDTYGQSYRKLNKEYKQMVDGYYNSNIGLTILDWIVKIAIFWITIPYQAILMLIGMFAPNFVISKNGILVSIPKGYDVGNLGAVGAYYSSFSFIDEALSNQSPSASSGSSSAGGVVYKDEYGNSVELEEQGYVINDRHEKVYKDKNGNEYLSDDGGKHVYKDGE